MTTAASRVEWVAASEAWAACSEGCSAVAPEPPVAWAAAWEESSAACSAAVAEVLPAGMAARAVAAG
ncbi:hypothetical protein D3C78_1828850 [compost metagenome]